MLGRKFRSLVCIDLGVATGKLQIYHGNSSNTLSGGNVHDPAGAAWLDRDVVAIHSEATGHDGLLAKNLPYRPGQLVPERPQRRRTLGRSDL